MSDVGLQIAAENIDRVVTVEIRRPGVVRGFKDVLYQVARDAADGPLCLGAAEMLDCDPCRVTLVTGAAVPEHMPVGENDGPFGTTVLAATLERLGHTVTVATDRECAGPIEALLRRAGANVAVVELRMGDDAQQDALAEAADLLVAIERLGGNPSGHLYGMTAIARDAFRCNVDRLFAAHTRLGRSSLGIGDGGNEIGFGSIRAELARRLPQIEQADKTACGGGVFSVVPTTRLLVASTSNLGAYAVCAALALLRRDSTLCHSPEDEFALHHVGVGLGLVDGGGGGRIAACDGIPADANAAIVRLMRVIVERALLPPRPRAF